MAGFKAAGEKLETVTAAAVAAAPQDVEALKVQFAAIGQSCGGCHDNFHSRGCDQHRNPVIPKLIQRPDSQGVVLISILFLAAQAAYQPDDGQEETEHKQ